LHQYPVLVVGCPGCDLLQRVPPLLPGATARCPRCGDVLAAGARGSLQRPLALAAAAAMVFVIANTAPLMELSASGREASTTILGGTYELWRQGYPFSAAVVGFCSVAAPAAYIGFVLTVLLASLRAPAPRWVGDLVLGAAFMRPWAMPEVMLLGILVALVKIADLATVTPGLGLYATGALVLLVAAIAATFEPAEIWKRVVWADGTQSFHGVAP
jgi:paraquat-inducible protein A